MKLRHWRGSILGRINVPTLTISKSIFAASRPLAIALILVALLQAGLLLVSIFISGALVARLSELMSSEFSHDEWRTVLSLVALFATTSIMTVFFGTIQAPLATSLTYAYARWVRERILRVSLGPKGIGHLEDPVFRNLLQESEGAPIGLPEVAVVSFSSVLSGRLIGIGAGILLGFFRWWAPLVLASSMLLLWTQLGREWANIWKPISAATSDLRRSDYYRDLIVTSSAAKEIRIFGLASWITDRFGRYWKIAISPVWKERRTLRLRMLMTAGLIGAAYGVTFLSLAAAASSHQLTLFQLVVFAQAALGMLALGFSGDENLFYLKSHAQALQRLASLPTLAAKAHLEGKWIPERALPQKEILLENVSFTYPGTDRVVLDRVTLDIRAGRSLAIVGDNGAGKTTLVKLLARLFNPTDGRILIDQFDLRDIDPSAWRYNIAVIFQDFIRYELSVTENVVFGNSDGLDTSALARISKVTGLDQVISRMPLGWKTVLSKSYRNGTELSGGEWQKIALARALYSVSQGGLLILDEPTANLDVRTEADFFREFLRLSGDLTSILISHRFPTVRLADEICLLEDGRIAERGSHSMLMEQDGRYATLFRLQASLYGANEHQ